jgi:hypothetical protein
MSAESWAFKNPWIVQIISRRRQTKKILCTRNIESWKPVQDNLENRPGLLRCGMSRPDAYITVCSEEMRDIWRKHLLK